MKHSCYSFLLVLLSNLFATAQSPTVEWQKCAGGSAYDFGYSIATTSDGGTITTGYTESTNGDVTLNHGAGDCWVVKQNSTGAIQWQRTFGGSAMDYGYSIQQTADGGYIIAGYTESTNGDISVQHGNGDCWILKLDVNGTIEWQKTIGGSMFDNGQSIQQTGDGGYILAGYSTSNDGDITGTHGAGDCMLVKMDVSGNIIWINCYGGSAYDYGQFVSATSDGGYIISAYTQSADGDVSGACGNGDSWIIKTDAFGAILWQHTYGGTSYDYSQSITQCSDGTYLATGYTESNDHDVSGNHGGGDCWVFRLDAGGALLWQRSLGSSCNDYGYSVKQTSDGNVLAAGYSECGDGDVTSNHGNYDSWILHLDISGNLQSQESLGGSATDIAYDVQVTTDGGYVLTGYSDSNDGDLSGNHGGGDLLTIKSFRMLTGINPENGGTGITLSTDNDTVVLKDLEENSFVEIYDVSGRLVRNGPAQNGEFIFSEEATGIYVYLVRTKTSLIKGKIIL
jgi:hypothetical protein